jgi:RNA polymerase sigma factor (sigma-70 family)
MADGLPFVLRRLLDASTPTTQETSWEEFIAEHSRIILHITRSVCPDHDGAMDRYAFILDQLRQDNYRRLRTFAADGRSQFTTWLVVVVQRLCIDYQRHQYGRHRPGDVPPHQAISERDTRRRLADFIGADIDLDSLSDHAQADGDTMSRDCELQDALEAAVSQLSPGDQLLIKLRFEDELSIRDTAIALGLPSRFQVYRRLKQVLGVLRSNLKKGGVDDARP